MKKKIMGRKLSRDRGSRKALFRSLIAALVKHGAIKTTKAKAKAIQADIDKIINLAKGKSVSKKRQVYAFLGNNKEISETLFLIVESGFSKRRGGYTRIINLPKRRGDAAPMVRLEWVEEIAIGDKEKKVSKKGNETKPEGTFEKAKAVVRSRKKSDVRTAKKVK
jgi:large subunit ribosomal protein L17